MARRKNPTGSIAKFDPGDEAWRCCAEAKQRPGERCRNKVTPGRRTCRMHGGTSPGRRPLTGRHTALASRLLKMYRPGLNDPTMLDMREPLALLDAIVHRLIERVEEFDTEEFREKAIELYDASRVAINAGNAVEGGALLDQLGVLLHKGGSEDSALMALLKSVKAQGDMIDKTVDKLLKKENAIPTGDVSLLMLQVLTSLRKSLDEVNAVRAVDGLERDIFIPCGMSDGDSGIGHVDAPSNEERARYVDVEEVADGVEQ